MVWLANVLRSQDTGVTGRCKVCLSGWRAADEQRPGMEDHEELRGEERNSWIAAAYRC